MAGNNRVVHKQTITEGHACGVMRFDFFRDSKGNLGCCRIKWKNVTCKNCLKLKKKRVK